MGKVDDFKRRYGRILSGKNESQDNSLAEEQNSSAEAVTPQQNTPERQTHSRAELPKEVAKALNDYLYSTDGDYSNTVADYISSGNTSEQERIMHQLNLIEHMKREFKKRPDKSQPKINRRNLVDLTMIILQAPPKNDKVDKKAEKFLEHISEVSAKDYMRHGKDSFLQNLSSTQNDDTKDYIAKLSVQHVQRVLEKIAEQKDKSVEEIQQDKLKYARFLRRNKFKQYIPEELLAALNRAKEENTAKPRQPKDNPSDSDTGDTTMTDENEQDENIDQPNDEQNNEPAFTLTKAQLWAAEHASVNWKECKSVDEVVEKVKDAGYVIEGDKVLKLGEGDEKETVAEYDKDKDEMKEVSPQESNDKEGQEKDGVEEKGDDKKGNEGDNKNPLTINAADPNENENNIPQPTEDRTWIEKKIHDYKVMEAEGKIGHIEITKGQEPADREFEVNVNGGTVHYTSPDNVSISNDAKIETFEAVVMEPDNESRPINFSENMPHDMAVRLVAACVLHDNKMQGNVPNLSAEDMQLLQSELGERYGDFQQKLQAMVKPKEERTDDENPASEKPKEEKSRFSTIEELGKAADKMKEIREKFDRMQADGLIAVTTNLETKKPEIVAGPALSGKSPEEQEQTVKSANDLIAAAAAIAQPGRKAVRTEHKLDNPEQKDMVVSYNEERLHHIRSTMDQKKLAEHDALADNKEGRAARREQMDVDMSVKLGIIPPPEGNDNKALEGEELDKYIAKFMTGSTYKRLWEKANPGKPMGEEQNKLLAKITDFETKRQEALGIKKENNTR